MNVYDAMLQRRSIRKFLPKEVPADILREILQVARLYPSGGNLQPIRFAVVTNPEKRNTLFADLRWAMYLPDFTIREQERPTAYIVLLRDDRIRHNCDYDVGAASTMVMLAAVSYGLATCPIGNFNTKHLTELLQLEDSLKPELVIALGYPDQESSVVPMGDSVKYTEDAHGNILVPKWSVEDILISFD